MAPRAAPSARAPSPRPSWQAALLGQRPAPPVPSDCTPRLRHTPRRLSFSCEGQTPARAVGAGGAPPEPRLHALAMRHVLLLITALCCACTPAVSWDCQGRSCTCTDGLTCTTSPCDATTSSCAFTCST